MDDARALLDQLMGKDRHLAPELQRGLPKFTDEEVCKNHLLGLCPHELFTNTKYDIGPCKKAHDDHLKEKFEGDKSYQKYRRKWRPNLLGDLRRLLTDVDRRIALNKAKIDKSQTVSKEIEEETKNKLDKAKKEMAEVLKQAEGCAEEGMVEESKELMSAVEMLKKQVEELAQPRHEKYKKELICEVCGVIVDSEEAAAIAQGKSSWHEKGRQHTGFKTIREWIEKLKEEEEKEHTTPLKDGDGAAKDKPKDDESKDSDDDGKAKKDKKEDKKDEKKDDKKDRKEREGSRSKSRRKGRSRSVRKKEEKGGKEEKKRKRSSSSGSRKKDRSRSRDRKKKRSRSRRRRSSSRKRSEKRSRSRRRSRSRKRSKSRSRRRK
eukprot:TRINITY_DN114594_c0_g1_i1.p1 TRINITY_DN114594_c0_g1~~TRINITY_DN114594_c0_g1_i1.p1  ORF type:complete len:377 (-),score=158.26 TRINITY_DN114594_c0_g1_i1:110-1240(-)